MEATQILKFQARQAKELSFTEGLKEEDEVAELEGVEKNTPVEDLRAYLKGVEVLRHGGTFCVRREQCCRRSVDKRGAEKGH